MNEHKNVMYMPGVCNIGPQEIRQRKIVGWTGLVITIALLVFFMRIGLNPAWRFFLIIPATFSAAGFVQAYLKFCFAFGIKGVFNFGSLGSMQSIQDKESLARDRTQALKIISISLLIGIFITIVAYFI